MDAQNSALGTAMFDPTNIIDVTTADFQDKVLYGSLQTPVLAYFTASWCGPCKALRPLIEKVAKDYVGKLTIARIDIDAAPEIAESLRVQSVPMVYAFVGGQPVDGFMGALPESELRAFFNKILALAGLPTPAAAKDIDDSDPLAEVFQAWGDGNLVQAQMALGTLPSDDPQLKNRIAAAKELFTALLPHGSAQALAQANAPAQNPTAETLYIQAQTLLAHGQLPAAMQALLASIQTDRKFQDEAARQLLVKLFDVLGFDHPLSMQGRKASAKILFA